MQSVQNITQVLTGAIVNPLLLLLFAVGLLIFIWGIVEFLWGLNRETHMEEGKRHMLWGILGMFIMAASYAIINLLISMVGAISL